MSSISPRDDRAPLPFRELINAMKRQRILLRDREIKSDSFVLAFIAERARAYAAEAGIFMGADIAYTTAKDVRAVLDDIIDEAERLDAAGKQPRKKRTATLAEAEIAVAEFLKEHAKADPQAIRRDRVAEFLDIGAGTVSNTTAWKAFDAERKKRKPRGPRTVPLTDPMLAVIPDAAQSDADAEIVRLAEEQREDAENDARMARRARRH